MTKVPLTNGAYEARSVIADAQRAVNLYMEKNMEGAASPYTSYPTPGLTLFSNAPISQPVRGLYTASNNELFAVIGLNVYYINPVGVSSLLGTMSVLNGNNVDMQDNDVDLVIVDGTSYGYTVNLATHAFSPINDPTGAFVGSNTVSYLDGFLIFNKPGTKEFYTTLNNTIGFDALYYASKTSYPDSLMGVNVKGSEIWLIGERTTEVWYNAGNTAFPFAEVNGTGLSVGCVSVYTICKDQDSLFWLSRDDRGQAMVLMSAGYEMRKVSTFALETEWAKYPTVADSVAYTCQFNGHFFYVITFPSADKTWVFDKTTGFWHQWAWMDSNGQLHRHRSNCFALAYGKLIVGDFQNGKLYELDQEAFTDNGDPILRLRSFPHLGEDGKRVIFHQFLADMEVGTGPSGDPLQVSLRWSDTRGKSWGEPVLQGVGAQGEYLTAAQWRRLGTARDRVFELSWSFPYETALNGAYVEVTLCAT